MKSCEHCGYRNLVDPKEDMHTLTCSNCEKPLFNKPHRKNHAVTDGCRHTKRKLQHDELPWDCNN